MHKATIHRFVIQMNEVLRYMSKQFKFCQELGSKLVLAGKGGTAWNARLSLNSQDLAKF
jgi:hypothetical protein